MSGPLRIGLSSERLEALRVDVVVVSCPSDERPLRALASRADWRCCGALSKLLRDGSFRGEVGEAALLAGGGVRGGQVYGSTDRHSAQVADQPVSPGDLTATVMHHLGIDHTQQYVDEIQKLRHRLSDGTPVKDLG